MADYFNPCELTASPVYSHAARISGGRLVLVSGQLALDARGELAGPGDMAIQAARVFANVRTALEAAGADVDDIVSIDTYDTARGDLPAYREARKAFFETRTAPPPVSVAVQVAGLVLEEAVLEVSVVAVVT